MVICKYFQQGYCRFDTTCKFEHAYGNRTKIFNTERTSISSLVADDVTIAEAGGQWLLSCYGPFKEKPCVPEMEDVSPEEVRWEMYQAQKNGNVDQINAQFQQMCEVMRAKRRALKNPTPAIVSQLEKLQNTGQEVANKSQFSFTSPQLLIPNTTNVFAQKTFVSNSPFSSTFNSVSNSTAGNSLFNRSTVAPSVFGEKPSFGQTSVFGGSSVPGSSIFGGNQQQSGLFNSGQDTPSFGALATQNTVFNSSAAQSSFGSAPVFGSGTQANAQNIFSKPQAPQQPNSVFSSFAFGEKKATSNVFGNTGSVFGIGTTPKPANPTNNRIFPQQQNTSIFGSPTIFGNAAAPQQTSTFGTPSTFGENVSAPGNVFGNSINQASPFTPLNQNTNVFGAHASTTLPNAFTTPSNTNQFGTTSDSQAAPFAASTFGEKSVFGGSAENSSIGNPFAKPNAFGFGTPSSEPASAFGANPLAKTSLFANDQTFSNKQQNFPFGSPNTSTSISTSNPFLSGLQGIKNLNNPTLPVGQSPFGFGSITLVIDETAYSLEGSLTDDEKAAYQSDCFTMGKIPLKPPTKELR